MMNYFKLLNAAVAVLILAAGVARGAVVYNQTFTNGFANGGFIPDNDPLGWTDSHVVSGLSTWSITDVQVSFDIRDGFNGDLYGYLRYGPPGGGPGILMVLLDRVGDPSVPGGYGDSGFDITLSDAGAHPIENYQNFSYTVSLGQLQGIWQANDGSDSFGGVGGTFSGLVPDGTWSLFLADLSPLDQSRVVEWGLTISAVPEPSTWALMGIGGMIVAARSLRRWKQRKLASKTSSF